MTMPSFTMKELLEAGIHFGHQKNRWNPKMEPYLFGERNGIHIIDLQQTFPLISTGIERFYEISELMEEEFCLLVLSVRRNQYCSRNCYKLRTILI